MKLTTLALALAGTTLVTSTTEALNEPTHRIVNQVAADTPATLNSFLQTQLGLLRGIAERLKGERIAEWLGEGGIREDDLFPVVRVFRHFHDPLKPWDSAGLSGLFDSSIRWMQRTDQDQGWSWQRARNFYWTALTTADPVAREQAWADTFRAAGQIMHLIVDASVPEHARNDLHALEFLCRSVGRRCYGNYEYWVSDQHGRPGSPAESAFIATYLSSPIGFDATILQQPTGDLQAPIPIARLIDTNIYNGTDPNVTLLPAPHSPAIGIAEFANANFFSDDTGSNLSYPFPRVDRLVPFQLPAPKTGRGRAYFKKGPGDGLNVEPVLAECVFYETANAAGVLQPIAGTCTDENVWDATAHEMLPRAVGYARGALDYFFRGHLEIVPPERFLYGRTNLQEPFQVTDPANNVNVFTRLRFKVRNATPNEETACPAGQQCSAPQLRAVVQYRTGGGADLIKAPQTGLSDALFFAVSEPLAVAPTRDFQELTFDFSATPLPANVADVFLTVVYRGPLGLEPDAVMVAGKDLFEPTPVIFANGTDYFCFNGVLQHVADFSAFPPFDLSNPHPTPPQPRDPTDDGIPDLFGPADEFSVLVKAAAAVTVPSGSNSDQLPLPQRTYGQYTRFVVLQDQPTFVLSELADSVVEKGLSPQRVDSNVLGATSYLANYNRLVVNPDGSLAHQYAGSGTYRGVVTTQFAVFVHQPVADFLPCFAESATKDPLTLIDSPVIGP